MTKNSANNENPLFRKGIHKRATIYGILLCILVIALLFIFLSKGPVTRLQKESAVFAGLFFTFILSYKVFVLITKND